MVIKKIMGLTSHSKYTHLKHNGNKENKLMQSFHQQLETTGMLRISELHISSKSFY